MDDHTEPNANDINTVWEQTKIADVKTSEACLGFKQKTKKEWITKDTWQTIENRRKLKKQINETKSKRLQERSQDAVPRSKRSSSEESQS